MDITKEADEWVTSAQTQAVKLALTKAESVHHHYETVDLGGKRDSNWAEWYAEYLKDHTEGNLFSDTDRDNLRDALERATTAQVFHKDYTWEDFAASYIVNYIINK